jgi:hypothetical protein
MPSEETEGIEPDRDEDRPVLNPNPVTNDDSNSTTKNPKLGKTTVDASSAVAEQSAGEQSVAHTIRIVVSQPEEIKNVESPKKSTQFSDDGDRELCR